MTFDQARGPQPSTPHSSPRHKLRTQDNLTDCQPIGSIVGDRWFRAS